MQEARDGGRCVHCSNPAVAGKVRCEPCAERARQSNRKRYQRLKEARLLNPPPTKSPQEIADAKERAKQAREEYERQRRLTPEWREYQRQHQRKKAQQARETGNCIKCSQPEIHGQLRCEPCAQKNAPKTKSTGTTRRNNQPLLRYLDQHGRENAISLQQTGITPPLHPN